MPFLSVFHNKDKQLFTFNAFRGDYTTQGKFSYGFFAPKPGFFCLFFEP